MGVTERGFEIEVAGERVPGIIWAPEGAKGPRPLLLQGHGGTQHKRTEGILARARSMVRHHGYAVIAIDAPGHGDRTTPEAQAAAQAALAERMRNRQQTRPPEEMRVMSERTRRAVPEWKATLDAAQQLDYVGEGPVGYWGVSMGTAIGVPFIASEPRIKAAVLGLAGLRPGAEEFEKDARSITIPILFVFQWHDQLVSREAGIALFDAFGSRQKTMHINPGGHTGIPAFEREAFESFFVRHLGRAES
ncbi:MAG TPA: dienelactone hydrolase family protein [Dehalococcoidia bacterium]|nr:dienelactone hydrolase family protein [Dehalococcoidia bacterium]